MRFLFRIYNYYFSPDRNFARRLKSLLGFTPVNLSIFKLAFYHKSTSNEKLQSIQSNERLEYLGDAILGTIVAEYLFKKYPNSNEGFLTKMRSKIVKRNSLNKIADKMGLDVFLAHYNNTRLSRSMLGNALEALVGAIYLECGYRGTRNYVIHKILRGYLDIHELEQFDDNYKSQLLEWCQKNGQTVAYKMLAKYKYEKRDRFKVAVLIDGEKLATADDFNKKSAEQTASEKALRQLGLLDSESGQMNTNGKAKKTSKRGQLTETQNSRGRTKAKSASTDKPADKATAEAVRKQPEKDSDQGRSVEQPENQQKEPRRKSVSRSSNKPSTPQAKREIRKKEQVENVQEESDRQPASRTSAKATRKQEQQEESPEKLNDNTQTKSTGAKQKNPQNSLPNKSKTGIDRSKDKAERSTSSGIRTKADDTDKNESSSSETEKRRSSSGARSTSHSKKKASNRSVNPSKTRSKPPSESQQLQANKSSADSEDEIIPVDIDEIIPIEIDESIEAPPIVKEQRNTTAKDSVPNNSPDDKADVNKSAD